MKQKDGGLCAADRSDLDRIQKQFGKAVAKAVVEPVNSHTTQEVASRHRYSIACFIDPDAEARVAVDPRFIKEGEQAKYPETTGLDYLLMKLREAQGVDK